MALLAPSTVGAPSYSSRSPRTNCQTNICQGRQAARWPVQSLHEPVAVAAIAVASLLASTAGSRSKRWRCLPSSSAAACARAHGQQRPASIRLKSVPSIAAEASVETTVAPVSAAVVKIFVTRQRASLAVPWQTQQVESTSGSGTFIMRHGTGTTTPSSDPPAQGVQPQYWDLIDVAEAVSGSHGDLVLTAAHVIADARDIRVQLPGSTGASPDKYVARVVAVAHSCDLALLEVMDSQCFEGTEPMRLFGPKEVLSVQSRVQVMGFPVGGDYLSITEGVLSRVEVVDYSHSRRPGLALTVDAAINAGNSGGPVVDPLSGRMVAVAHQK
ncbi:unnamed protein product, partial [Polarella glacialis]